jgi:hypothetical protein
MSGKFPLHEVNEENGNNETPSVDDFIKLEERAKRRRENNFFWRRCQFLF